MKVHGKLMYQAGGIGSTADNLQAMTGEYGNRVDQALSRLCPNRPRRAGRIAVLFEQISQIEKDHEFRL